MGASILRTSFSTFQTFACSIQILTMADGYAPTNAADNTTKDACYE